MKFMPKFIVSDSIEHTADLINQPHEDYPKRVEATKEILDFLVEEIHAVGNRATLGKMQLLSFHAKLMWDLPQDKGQWRTCNVIVGGSYPPSYLAVPNLLFDKGLLTIERSGWAGRYPWMWYQEFQEVHPFRDGNGRVGGIVLAFLTYNFEDGQMLVPCQ